MATTTKVIEREVRTTATHGKQRWEGEDILAFIARRLVDDPPAPRGTKPKAADPKQSPSVRDTRPYFSRTKLFPDGITIGGYEVYRVGLDGSTFLHNFVCDLSLEQMRELECLVEGRPFITYEERKEQRVAAQARRGEIQAHGHATTTAPIEERAIEALRALPKLSAKKRKAVLEAILAEEDEG